MSVGGGAYLGGVYTTPGVVTYPNGIGQTTFVPTDPFAELLKGRRNHLSESQLARLMDHEFIPMEEAGHPYCLMCYALDVYRTQSDHEFVIHEE